VHISAGIAHHYLAAGEQAAALAASVTAAAAADRVHAHGEAAALLERAIELWDRVPNAEALAGTDRVQLLASAAGNHRGEGDYARAETLVRRALDMVDEKEDPHRAAFLLEQLARAQWQQNRGPAAIESTNRGLNLLPEADKSRERARLLGYLSKVRMLQGRYMETLDLAEQAIEAAEAAGDPLAEGRARNARGIALAALGDLDAGSSELRRSLAIALENEFFSELDSAYANLADALHLAGRTREGLEILEEGVRTITEMARAPNWLGVMVAEFEWALGNWKRSEATMPPSERRQIGTALLYTLLQRAGMELAYGNDHAARERLQLAESLVADSTEPQWIGVWGVLTAQLRLREGDIDAARDAVEVALDRIEFCTEDVSRIVRLSAIGVAVEAEAAQRCRDLGEDPSYPISNAEMMLARVRAASVGDRPLECAWLATAEAEMSRVHGDPDPALWSTAVEEWEAIEWPYEAALARWREAEAYVHADDREAAAVTAAAALDTARRLGARWLQGELEGLVARARLRLEPDEHGAAAPPPEPVAEEDPFGLTPRERQVLALLAEGMTNREIGERLYMAEKTASVHVSRILAKLDVRTRTQAAAVAHRLGLEREVQL
jgi:DNA-binding CsgD family transcriptional regulator